MARKPRQFECQWCGDEFWSANPEAKHCSHSCAGKTVTRRRAERDGRVRHPCSFEGGCDRISHARGLCLMHYKRVLKRGTTEAQRQRRPAGMAVRDWFMSKVEKTETCWLWRGNLNRKRGRYGMFYDADTGRKIYAHHYLVPPIPPGPPKMEYDHLCRTPLCVRPDHLELVTAAENRKREAVARGRKRHDV